MKYNELKGELLKKGYSVNNVAKMLNISNVALYRKLKTGASLRPKDIKFFRNLLTLTDSQVIDIFIND